MERIRLVLYADNGIGGIMRNQDICVPDTAEIALQRVIKALAEFQNESHPLRLPTGNVISALPEVVADPEETPEKCIVLLAGTYSDGREMSGYDAAYLAAMSVSKD